jgi:hypothetical protein
MTVRAVVKKVLEASSLVTWLGLRNGVATPRALTMSRLLPLAPNLGANLDVTSIDRAFQVARRGREEEKSDGRDAWRGKEGWPGTYCVVHMRTPSHADILLRCGRRWAIMCSVKYCASANLRKSSRALPAPNLKSRAIVQSVPSA